MPDQDPRAEEVNGNTSVEPVSTTRLKSSGEVVVPHYDAPPPAPLDKQIHDRRPLPRVPERITPPAEDVEGKPEPSE